MFAFMHEQRNAHTYKKQKLTLTKKQAQIYSIKFCQTKESNAQIDQIYQILASKHIKQSKSAYIAMESGRKSMSLRMNSQGFQPSDGALPPRRVSCLRRKRHLAVTATITKPSTKINQRLSIQYTHVSCNMNTLDHITM